MMAARVAVLAGRSPVVMYVRKKGCQYGALVLWLLYLWCSCLVEAGEEANASDIDTKQSHHQQEDELQTAATTTERHLLMPDIQTARTVGTLDYASSSLESITIPVSDSDSDSGSDASDSDDVAQEGETESHSLSSRLSGSTSSVTSARTHWARGRAEDSRASLLGHPGTEAGWRRLDSVRAKRIIFHGLIASVVFALAAQGFHSARNVPLALLCWSLALSVWLLTVAVAVWVRRSTPRRVHPLRRRRNPATRRLGRRRKNAILGIQRDHQPD